MRKMFRRLDELQATLAERRIPDLLAYGLAVFSIIFGVVMISTVDAYLQVISFKPAFDLAKPEMWGIMFAGSGALLGVGFWRDRKSGQYAAVVLTVLYAMFGFFASHAPASGAPGAVWSGPAVYTFVSYVCVVCVVACGSKAERPG